MVENDSRLKIIGDNNYISICRNVGSVSIVGNECSIDVLENYGSVEVVSARDTVKINVCENDRDVHSSTTFTKVKKDHKSTQSTRSIEAMFKKFVRLYLKDLFKSKHSLLSDAHN